MKINMNRKVREYLEWSWNYGIIENNDFENGVEEEEN